MNRTMTYCVFISLVLASVSFGVQSGYESLLNWNDLPKTKYGITVGLVSSFDQAGGGNNDYNQYLSPSGLLKINTDTVVTELTGPGIITRFWMPHATANGIFKLKMTVDGVVQINTNSNTFLDGQFGYVASPLVRTLVGGQVSYEPIAFQNSLKIESNNFSSGGWAKEHHYYQYNYQALSANAVVTPFSGVLTADQQAARTGVVNMINNVGANPAGPSGNSSLLTIAGQSILPASSLVLGNLTGHGQIRCLNLKMPANPTDTDLENLRLRVRYDGSSANAIDVPVANFFGAGHGRVLYKSLPLGTDSPDGYYCYWPMPFRQGVVVELYNSGQTPISIDSAKVEYETGPVPGEAGYLHAVYNKETTIINQAYHQLLNVQGQGHYVGNLLYIEKAGDSRSILEADDIVTVNPGKPDENALYGTGLEDAYNGGYYYNHVLEQTNDGEIKDPANGIGPYNGLLYMDFYDMPGFIRTRTDQYRWLIGDYIPFTDGLNVKIENYGGAGVLYGSTAFYYATPKPGDANNDEQIDVSDLGILAANYGRTSDVGWNTGDFNLDGKVDVSDLGILAAHYATGTGESLNVAGNGKAQALGLVVDATGKTETEKDETTTAPRSSCSAAGVFLVAGILLAGLMAGGLKVKS